MIDGGIDNFGPTVFFVRKFVNILCLTSYALFFVGFFQNLVLLFKLSDIL